MPASSLDPLDLALFNLLSGQLTDLEGQPVPVYDHVPNGAAFPYVTFTSDTVVPWNDHTSRGAEVTRTISIWSRYSGYHEATSIAAGIERLLDHRHAALVTPGWRAVACILEYNERLREPDDRTRRIVQRYRIQMEPG